MKTVYLLLITVLIGVGVALTYFVLEGAVRLAIDFVWHDMFDTNTNRLLVLPLCLALTLVYFGVQHYWDKANEKKQERGLGAMPTPTVLNYVKILVIGFLSLIAGASLGPEAVLVPACMVLGAYAGLKLFHGDKHAVKILSAAGFVALFAAFFNSFFVGLLAILLVTKQAKVRLSPKIITIGIVASASSAATLHLLSSSSYFHLPELSWGLTFTGALALIALFALGASATFLLEALYRLFTKWYVPYVTERQWWIHAVVAAAGLTALYLVGGPLIQFTGNESIVPLFEQASTYGLIGLAIIFITKIAAIAWSKALGYRGGLVFPTIFVAATLVAFASQITDVNFVYGLVVALAGALVADTKAKILL